MVERQRSQSTSEEAVTGERSIAVNLWKALRTEQRRSVERTMVGFGRCGWRDEAAERVQQGRRL